jgi:hypothetical protein
VPGRTGLRRVAGWAGRLLSRVRLLRRTPRQQPVSAMAVDGLAVRPPALSVLLSRRRLQQAASGRTGGDAGAPDSTAEEAVAARGPVVRPLVRRGFVTDRTARRASSGPAAAAPAGPASSGTRDSGTALGPGGLVARLRRGSAGRAPLATEPAAGPVISASSELPLAPARVVLGGSATSPAQSTSSASRGASAGPGSTGSASAAAGTFSGGFPGTLAGVAPGRSGLPGGTTTRAALAVNRAATAGHAGTATSGWSPGHPGLSSLSASLSASGPGLAAPAPYGPAVSGPGVTELAMPGAGLAGLAALGRQAAPGATAGSVAPAGLTVSRSVEGLPGAASNRADRPGTAASRSTAGAPGAVPGVGLSPAPAGAGTAPASLISRPVAGPSVQNPTPASGLAVLGAGVLPAGVVPDPTGAVRVTPERPSVVSGQSPARPGPASGGPGHTANAGLRRLHGTHAPHDDHRHAATGPGGLRSRDAGPSVSAEWSGAVRPARTHDDGPDLPAAASPQQRWHAAISSAPLEAPRPLPSAFHELARSITGRAYAPRYTTGPATRRALSAAGALGATTGSVVHLAAPPTAGPQVAAVLAHELSHARTPVSRPRFLLGGLTGGDDDERQAVATGRRYLGGLPGDGLPGGLSGAAESVGAGIVGNLPVGRDMGPVAEMATQAARAAVLEATAATSGIAASLSSAGSQLAGGASGMVDSAMSAVSGGSAPSDDGAPGGGPGGAAGGGPGGGSVVSGPGGSKAAAALDPDRVIEVVQERLLREIERRGGRWVGVF